MFEYNVKVTAVGSSAQEEMRVRARSTQTAADKAVDRFQQKHPRVAQCFVRVTAVGTKATDTADAVLRLLNAAFESEAPEALDPAALMPVAVGAESDDEPPCVEAEPFDPARDGTRIGMPLAPSDFPQSQIQRRTDFDRPEPTRIGLGPVVAPSPAVVAPSRPATPPPAHRGVSLPKSCRAPREVAKWCRSRAKFEGLVGPRGGMPGLAWGIPDLGDRPRELRGRFLERAYSTLRASSSAEAFDAALDVAGLYGRLRELGATDPFLTEVKVAAVTHARSLQTESMVG